LLKAEPAILWTANQKGDFRQNDKRRVYSSSIKVYEMKLSSLLIYNWTRPPLRPRYSTLNNLLLAVAIFISTHFRLLFIILITRWLFYPINEASFCAYLLNSKPAYKTPLVTPIYKEAKRNSITRFEAIQALKPPKECKKSTKTVADIEHYWPAVKKSSVLRLNFRCHIQESKQRSFVFFIWTF